MRHINLLQERLEKIQQEFSQLFNSIKDKTVLITGANGFIGSLLTFSLVKDVKVFCLVRNIKSMQEQFLRLGGEIKKIHIVENLGMVTESVDIVIHCASPTQSSFFLEKPIDTVDIIYKNLKDILEFSIQHRVEKFIFLSTMEVYGNLEGENIDEDKIGNFNILELRNSYPLSKQLSEFLVNAYSQKYSLKTSILRLTQIIGPGVKIDDKRVYMEFVRSSLKESKIVLATKGDTKRNYIDIFDVITAILFCIFDGKKSEIYNIANPDIYISIYDLAKSIASVLNSSIHFNFNQDTSKYLKTFKRSLKVKKIQELGWRPLFDINSSINDMINFVKEETKI
ncbi:NAD-dependent epimerase/dehydratase family protein [Campylobacter sp. LH-2024]|uniref:NAD-dependent epimerase/dehydratase family protein n=1 Tax=Campylobacter sp. LH-2024 TaxID=3239825 RepID=UPI003B797FBC